MNKGKLGLLIAFLVVYPLGLLKSLFDKLTGKAN